MIYIMTNKDTGEVITGTGSELKKTISISASTLNKYATSGSLFLKCWKIERVASEAKETVSMPDSFWLEWMKITHSLKKVFN